MFFNAKKTGRKCFSLIELLIVIGIMGALAALILPHFSDSESSAKDAVCDYNQAGTLRYLNMFKAANGVYPSGFHTGLAEDGSVLDNLTVAATHNFTNASTLHNLTETEIKSLTNAGIVKLAYDKTGLASNLSAGEENEGTVTGASVVRTVNTGSPYWTEEMTADGTVNATGAALTFRGASLSDIAALGAATTYDSATFTNTTIPVGAAGNFRSSSEPSFVIVPMFVAPTVDWDHYYTDGENDSKISIALAGKCPWGDAGTARYYITFFKVYTAAKANGDIPAAKLLATSCPDCGILEGDMF